MRTAPRSARRSGRTSMRRCYARQARRGHATGAALRRMRRRHQSRSHCGHHRVMACNLRVNGVNRPAETVAATKLGKARGPVSPDRDCSFGRAAVATRARVEMDGSRVGGDGDDSVRWLRDGRRPCRDVTGLTRDDGQASCSITAVRPDSSVRGVGARESTRWSTATSAI
jgi:hypothetical protein